MILTYLKLVSLLYRVRSKSKESLILTILSIYGYFIYEGSKSSKRFLTRVTIYYAAI